MTDTNETQATQENEAEQAPVQAKEQAQAPAEEIQEAAKPRKVEIDYEEYERLRNTIKEVNGESKDRRLKLREWEEVGKTPEEVKQMLKAQEDAEIAKMEEERQFQTLLEKEREEKKRIQEESTQKLTDFQERLKAKEKNRTISDLIARENADLDILKYVLNDRVAVEETEDGDFTTVALDENGQPLEGGVDALVASLKEHKSWSKAFPAPKMNGMGTQAESTDTQQSASKRIPKTSKLELNTLSKKDAFISKHGWEAYQNLPLTS